MQDPGTYTSRKLRRMPTDGDQSATLHSWSFLCPDGTILICDFVEPSGLTSIVCETVDDTPAMPAPGASIA